MSTSLSLHHLGEVIVAALLGRLAAKGELGKVVCKRHDGCSFQKVVEDASIPARYAFKDNVKLAAILHQGRLLGFDGAHGVDVLCQGGDRGLAIESKLGLDRLSAASFTDRFLGALTLSAHATPRINGNMIAVLDKRSVDNVALLLETKDPTTKLVEPWVLVIRTQTWKAWGLKPPELSPHAHVVIFEELAKAHGDHKDFDDLVTAVVGSAFHSAWEIF